MKDLVTVLPSEAGHLEMCVYSQFALSSAPSPSCSLIYCSGKGGLGLQKAWLTITPHCTALRTLRTLELAEGYASSVYICFGLFLGQPEKKSRLLL